MSRQLFVRVKCDRCPLGTAEIEAEIRDEGECWMEHFTENGELPEGWAQRRDSSGLELHDICPDCAKQP